MSEIEISFSSLGLKKQILKALVNLNYQKPSPIQIACIPYLLKGRDILGTAQTGSGKTAAFSLPILNNINKEIKSPQALVLTPTRELAIQVKEAFFNFSRYMQHINTVVLYGGQKYDIQLHEIRKGPQIVVGTPGRLLDHLKRKTINFSKLEKIVLDEADEMLRMGFIEDVERILLQIPKQHQTILFSATMPKEILRISRRFMNMPKEIHIESGINTRPKIDQKYWRVYGIKKNEALIRFLEVEKFEATIVFVRTKNSTIEISTYLEKNGYNSAPLNGDMSQNSRENTLKKFRDGRLNILIATDVAARGLDVDRINLVINYDIPLDSESYIHRIGRTGRAGRKGRALLFVENYEWRLLKNIEKIMQSIIPEVKLPSSEILVMNRFNKLANQVNLYLKSDDLAIYQSFFKKLKLDTGIQDTEILAAVLMKISQIRNPLVIPTITLPFNKKKSIFLKNKKKNKNFNNTYESNKKMNVYQIEIGKKEGIKKSQIITAIKNKKINNYYIGEIKLFSSYSRIEISKNINKKLLPFLTNLRIFNKLIEMKLIRK